MKKHVILFEGVSKTIKNNKILDNISLQIEEGDFHALIGPNGAGKSTLIRTLIFGNKIDSGEIKINGISYLDASSKSSLGYVPDKLHLSPFLTVKRFLLNFYLLSGFDKKTALEEIKSQLKSFNLSEVETKRFRRLSMGQQKKIILIQSLINKPKLLILDEPAANLDAFSEIELFKSLEKLNQEGVSILIISHRLDLVEKHAKNYSVIKEGKLLKSSKVSKNLFKELSKTLGGEYE